MDEINEISTMVAYEATVIEPTETEMVADEKTMNETNESAFDVGFKVGAGLTLGAGVVYGAGFALYKVGDFISKKIGKARNRRAARKAKEVKDETENK